MFLTTPASVAHSPRDDQVKIAVTAEQTAELCLPRIAAPESVEWRQTVPVETAATRAEANDGNNTGAELSAERFRN